MVDELRLLALELRALDSGEAVGREAAAARDELRQMLTRGTRAGQDIADMARHAGISRETAHKLLREAGILTNRQMHRAAEEAGIPQGEARAEWFRDKGWRD